MQKDKTVDEKKQYQERQWAIVGRVTSDTERLPHDTDYLSRNLFVEFLANEN